MELTHTRDDEPAHSHPSAFPLWAPIIFLIIYPLSIGPVARVFAHRFPPKPMLVFYKPLEAVYDSSDFAKKSFDWYIALWLPRTTTN